MSKLASEAARSELAEALVNLNNALAILDSVKAPECIGARLDHVIGEVAALVHEHELQSHVRRSVASG